MMAFWRKKPSIEPAAQIHEMVLAEPYYRVGDKVGDIRGSLLIQNRVHFAIAENGIVTWAGSNTEFADLIRTAARTAAQKYLAIEGTLTEAQAEDLKRALRDGHVTVAGKPL